MVYRILFGVILECFVNLAIGAEAANVDYEKARMKFAADPAYKPYAILGIESAMTKQAMQLWRDGDSFAALKKLDELLAIYPFSIMAHKMIGDSYESLVSPNNKPAQNAELKRLSKKYLEIAEKIITSITRGTQCSSFKDNCRVINIAEEEMVLWRLGFSKKKQSLDKHNGDSYDVLQAENGAGKKQKFVFNTSVLNADHK
ncbi:hypothetical protein [Undibacterium sp. Di24W]|uniref:hypothetical protein n=1 Tax=Undibacterium sp. Di24W TaxID=3413033 RepID=UPI003BF1ECC7